jgi:hypothetical protein
MSANGWLGDRQFSGTQVAIAAIPGSLLMNDR